jgi:hypothetical protein
MKKLLRIVTALLLVLPIFSGINSNAKAAGNSDIVGFATKLAGSPYRYGGSSPSGFDCSGFVSYVYSKFGIKLPRTASGQFSQGKAVKKSELAPGDLVYFTTTSKGPSHAGLYIGNRKFIHAASQRYGVIISSIDSNYFKPRFLGGRRYLQSSAVKAETTLLPYKKGQIGMVTVKKKINLWKRGANHKLTAVRVLKPGEKYRVYGKTGGQFSLGSNLYITNIAGYLDYIGITK